MLLTKVFLQPSCSSDRLSSHQQIHAASDSDGVATIGHPAPSGHHSWSKSNAAEERKSGLHLASGHVFHESVMNVTPSAGQSRPMSPRVDTTSATESFEPETPSKPQGGQYNLPNASSDLGNGMPNGLLNSGKKASQPQPAAATPPPAPSVEKSLNQRLTGLLGVARPAQFASGHSVTQRRFQVEAVRLIEKNRYDAYKEAVHTSLEAKWHESIHQKLRKNVEAVIQGIGLQPKEMAVNVGLSMVGPKVGDMLHLLPTIVISCAHKKAKTRIEELINSNQLDYLREFACPHLVCIQGREPKRRDRFFADTDSSEEVDFFRDISTYGFSVQRQKLLRFAVEQGTGFTSACGLRIEFRYCIEDEDWDVNLQGGRLEHERRMMARIGGTIYIGERAFAMTTAHTFLFDELDEENKNDNDSDSTSEQSLDGQIEYEADYSANHDQKTMQSKTTLWKQINNHHGSFAFCDHGGRFECQEFVSLMSPNSDWCTLSMDSIGNVTNHYCAQNEKGENIEVIVDEMGAEEIAQSGDIYILDDPEKPLLAYMTQNMVSIYFGGKSLNVRRLISECPLSAGISGCWVVRGKQLLGHIIGGNEFEKTIYMVGIQDTKRAIEEVTGENVSLEPVSGVEALVELPYSLNLEDPQFEDLESQLASASEAVEENIGHSSSVVARYRGARHSSASKPFGESASLMADIQWIPEPETGRWYVNYTEPDGQTIRRYSDGLQQSEQPRYQPEYYEDPGGYPPTFQQQYHPESGSGEKPSRRRTRETRPPIISSTSIRGTRRKSVSFPESSRHAEVVLAQSSRHERKYHESRYNQSKKGEKSNDKSLYETYRTPRSDPVARGEQEVYYEEDVSVLSATGGIEMMRVRDSDAIKGTHYGYPPPRPSAGLSVLNTAGPSTQWQASPATPPPQYSANVGTDIRAAGRGNARRRSRPITIIGDPRTGESEELNPSFRVRNTDYQTFFQCGRVFKTLWTDPAGPPNNNASEYDQFTSKQKFKVAHKQYVYSKIRRFVVVLRNDRSCQCLPVTTYGGKGIRKRGINLDAHGLIHNVDGTVPKVYGISKGSLEVRPAMNGERLSKNSVINYGRAYCVDTNLKVKDLGELNHESKKLLKQYYKEMQFPPEDDLSEPSYSYTQNPKLQAAQLTGVGGDAEDYCGPQAGEHEASMASRSSRSAGKRRESSSAWTDTESSGKYTSGAHYNAQEYDQGYQDDWTFWPPETEESLIAPSHGDYKPTFEDEYQESVTQEHYEQRPASSSIEDPSHLPPVSPDLG